jgi:hypothetical protein
VALRRDEHGGRLHLQHVARLAQLRLANLLAHDAGVAAHGERDVVAAAAGLVRDAVMALQAAPHAHVHARRQRACNPTACHVSNAYKN